MKSYVKGTLDDLANCGRSLINGRLIWLRLTIKFCWKFNEIRLNRNPATDKMNPVSCRWQCWKFDYFRFLIEAFYSFPLIYLSSLSPTLHFLDCCTFIIGFEVGLCQSSNLSFSIVFWPLLSVYTIKSFCWYLRNNFLEFWIGLYWIYRPWDDRTTWQYWILLSVNIKYFSTYWIL